MPIKKKQLERVKEEKVKVEKVEETEEDKESVSTDSDIESGTFSQYDDEEIKVEGEGEEEEGEVAEDIDPWCFTIISWKLPFFTLEDFPESDSEEISVSKSCDPLPLDENAFFLLFEVLV